VDLKMQAPSIRQVLYVFHGHRVGRIPHIDDREALCLVVLIADHSGALRQLTPREPTLASEQ